MYFLWFYFDTFELLEWQKKSQQKSAEPTKFSKRVGLGFLEEGCWERGVDFFQGGGLLFNKKKTKLWNI